MCTCSRPFAVCVLSLFVTGFSSGHEIWVSPDGNDAGPGSRERPFAGLERARAAVRHLVDAGLREPVAVRLRGGIHRRNRPLELGTQDSGSVEFAVTWVAAPGELPVISGGRPITGWRDAGDGVWEAPIKVRFNELFVNGRRAVRARCPNSGWLRMAGHVKDRRSGFHVTEGDLPAVDLAGAEAVIIHDWSSSRMPVKSVDHEARLVSLIAPVGRTAGFLRLDHFDKQARYCLENHAAFLDAPGEWNRDEAAGLVRYRPLPGERLADIQAVAPVAAGLLVVRGDAGTDKPVRNLHFKGIVFEHSAFLMELVGYYSGVQAAFHFPTPSPAKDARRPVPAAILCELLEDGSFVDCTFRHLGGSGLWLARQCRRSRASRCTFRDIAANGVMIGEARERTVGDQSWLDAAPGQVASGNMIEDCLVERTGRRFFGSIGIWAGIAANTRIANNEVREMPYTGISLGWRWDPKPTPCRANAIERNHIHHVMQLLSDGGGIYTLGLQPDSFLRENWIHDIPRNAGRAESNGMFLDQGTMDFVIEKNVIHGLPRSPLRFHMAITNMVRDNVLACVGKVPMIRYNRTKPEDIRKERNLTPKHETPEVESGFRGGAFRFRGGQCFDVAHRPELDPPEFTLSAYFKLDAPLSKGRDGRTWLVGKNTHEWTEGHFGLLLKPDSVAGAYLNIGGGRKNVFDAFSKPQAFAIGEWTRLSLSYDGRDLVLLVNGTEAARTAVNRPRKPGKGHLSIGRRPDGHTYFSGLIDEVELHNVRMAISEVAGPSRVGHWPCDQVPRGKDELAPHIARIRTIAGPRGE